MSVSNRLKRMIAAALAVVALTAGSLFVVPLFVSEPEARVAAIRALREATGVEPQILGQVRLALLPRPAIRLEAIRLDDHQRPAFTADALSATMQILPLFSGQVRVGALTFERPRLSVEIAADEAVVVGMPLRPRRTEERTAQPEIMFVDGIVLLKREGSKSEEQLRDLNAALAWSGSGITASGAFHWRSAASTFSFSIADTAAFGRGERTSLRLRLDGEPFRIGFEGGVAYRNGVQADGVLAVETKSLRESLSLLSVAPLTRGGFGPLKLKAQAALTANSLALTGLSVELDGSRAEGGLTAKYQNGRTVVQATLASETSDFTPYSGGFAVNADDGRDWSREPIDFGGLGAFDLDMRLSAGRVIVRKTELRRVAAAATVRNGRFTLSIGEAQFHGGTLRGRAALGQDEDGNPDVKLEATITEFDLGPGMAELASIQRLEGKGSLSVALEGSGAHVQEITRGLSGTVTFAAKDGALNGINVEQVLRRLERKPLSGAPDFGGGRTTFERMTAKLRVADGKAKVEEAYIDGPLVKVRVAGETSVADRDFDLKGVATLVRAAVPATAAPAFELPFIVLGPWDRPFLLPDPTALIQRSGAAAPLLDAARKQAAREKSAKEEEPAPPALRRAIDPQ